MPDRLKVAILGTDHPDESVLDLADFVPGRRIDTQVVLFTETEAVQGWSFAVAHDAGFVALLESSVTTDGTTVERLSGQGFARTGPTDGGYLSAIVLSFLDTVALPLGRNPICNAGYRLVADPGVEGTKFRFADEELDAAEGRSIQLVFTVNGESRRPESVFDGLVRRTRGPTTFKRGDMNADGRINLTDPVLVLGVLVGGLAKPFDCDAAMDSDDDGQVNLTDAIILLDWMFGRGPPPADPLWTCATADDGAACLESSPGCE